VPGVKRRDLREFVSSTSVPVSKVNLPPRWRDTKPRIFDSPSVLAWGEFQTAIHRVWFADPDAATETDGGSPKASDTEINERRDKERAIDRILARERREITATVFSADPVI
jgi:hypothetical protein